jgi:hypothetical protein
VKTKVDAVLLDESGRYRLRFACDHCVHFGDDGRCGHGYPPGPRMSELREGAALSFCKEFELA